MAAIWIPLPIVLLLVLACGPLHAKKNVLFLVADDMRPELSCYDGPDFPSPVHPKMHSPNLDKLASRSALLKKAYVQQAVCSPSRTSLLTGRRPDTTHVYDLVKYFRNVGGNFTTLPEYFKQQGYRSVGMGKVFHPGRASGYDDPISWSEPYYHAPYLDYWDCFNVSWRAVSQYDTKEKHLPDQDIAQHAIDTLQRLARKAKSGEQPFFVAVGFHRPHLPYVFPEEFMSYYPAPAIHLPPNPYAPTGMPYAAWYDFSGLRKYHDIKKLNATGQPNTTFPNDVILHLRRAYYSALTYTDDLIGKVLAEVDKLGLTDSTIVSFWGDHGYQLGEHGEWCKQTCFDIAAHAPMMIHIPGLTDNGVVIEQHTEFVDLYPTLTDAAGLPPPPLCPLENATKVAFCREGTSLIPLIQSPQMIWKKAVFFQYPRGKDIMGYSLRTDQFRYTEWVHFDYTTYKPNWNHLNATELYDHTTDPQENWNRADAPKYIDVQASLSTMLHLGWRHALPADK